MTREALARSTRIVAGAAACALVTFAYRYLSFTEFPNDHFVHLSIAQQITRGALPVRDFVERGFPLMSMLSAGAQVALGEGLRSELFLIAAVFAVAASLTYVVAVTISGSAVVAAIASLLTTLAYPVSYSFPKLLAPALACAVALAYVARPSSIRLALLGLVVAVSFLLRHDLGLLVGAGVAAMLVTRHGWSRESVVDLSVMVAITLLMLSPYLIWVQTYRGLGAYVADGVAFSSREAARSSWWWGVPSVGIDRSRPMLARLSHGPVVNVRWQPEASDAAIVEAERRHGLTRLDPNSPHSWQYELSRWSTDDVGRLVRDPLAADTNGIDRSTFELQVPAPNGLVSWLTRVPGPGDGLRLGANAIALFFYALWLLPLAAAAALIARWPRESPLTRALLVMIVVLQVAMNATMLRDPLETRMRDVVVPLALLLAYLAGLLWRIPGTRVKQVGMRLVALVMMAIVVGGAAALGGAPEQIEKTRVAEGVSEVRQRMRTLRRSLSPPDHRTGILPASYKPLVDYIAQCTPPESRLLTLTFAPELFFYTGRAFAGGQVSLSPGYFASDDDTRRLVDRASREDVSLVIMDSQTEKEMLDGYPRIAAYVRARYHEIGRFPLTSEKAFVLLGRDGASSSVAIAGQPRSCFAKS